MASNETRTSITEASSSTGSSNVQPLQPPPASSSTTSSSTSSSSSSSSGGGSSNSNSSQPAAAPARPARSTSNPAWTAQTAAISVSGPYITTSSIDGDSLIMSAELLERELVGPYKFTPHQLEIVHELTEGMQGCSTAFVAVALAGIALTVAASAGMPMEDAPEVLFNGITVGDVASWVDSLLVAYLLNFGASSFSRVEQTTHEERQLAYTFQGINRLGMMFTQLSIAATTVSIVTTLEAASKWPPLVTLASGLFFAAAVGRSGAMWYVLNKYGNTLDDVDAALEAQRRAYAAAHDEALPLFDRLAIRLAFTYLLQYSAAGRRPSEAALSSAVAVAVDAAAANEFSAADAAAAAAAGVDGGRGVRSSLAAATAAGMVAVRAGSRSASDAARVGLQLLQKSRCRSSAGRPTARTRQLRRQRRRGGGSSSGSMC
ncbi:hypothetical protein COO60DRAFT_546764 [Scenedesmus sp. NREL 46B-D3]|nr:hypothetical protein COO60DRAFT_546764 [Scenedesmus sp. NREL 46B-D3]